MLHTQRATAEHLVGVKNTDYIMTIKANQPRLLAAAQQALSGPGTDFVEHTEDDRGHGRTEERIQRTVAVTDEMAIDFPHAAQLFRVIRYVGGLDDQRRTGRRGDASALRRRLRAHLRSRLRGLARLMSSPPRCRAVTRPSGCGHLGRA